MQCPIAKAFFPRPTGEAFSPISCSPGGISSAQAAERRGGGPPGVDTRSASTASAVANSRLSRSGAAAVSASTNINHSPGSGGPLASTPTCMACTVPLQPVGGASTRTTWTRGSLSACARASSPVPSVDPSSTTTISSESHCPPWVCDRSPRRHSSITAASSRAGTPAVTFGGSATWCASCSGTIWLTCLAVRTLRYRTPAAAAASTARRGVVDWGRKNTATGCHGWERSAPGVVARQTSFGLRFGPALQAIRHLGELPLVPPHFPDQQQRLLVVGFDPPPVEIAHGHGGDPTEPPVPFVQRASSHDRVKQCGGLEPERFVSRHPEDFRPRPVGRSRQQAAVAQLQVLVGHRGGEQQQIGNVEINGHRLIVDHAGPRRSSKSR